MAAESYEAIPCTFCGAAAGEPCDRDCGHMNAYLEDHDLPEAPPLAPYEHQPYAPPAGEPLLGQASKALRKVTCGLPFAGLIADPPTLKPEYEGDGHDVWLAKMAVWLEDYRVLAAAKIEELQEGSRKAIGLQLEKDMVRHFLGVSL